MSVHVCPPEHRHADAHTCYLKHKCRCLPCRTHNTEYHYWQRHMRAAGRPLPHAVIDSTGTRRRLQALAWLGYSAMEIARRAGLDPENAYHLLRRSKVQRSTAAKIRALYDDLWTEVRSGTTKAERMSISRTRNMARARGWVGPLAWDDDTIDDPDAPPAPPVELPDVCSSAHPLTGENLYVAPSGVRGCRVCRHAGHQKRLRAKQQRESAERKSA